MSTTTNLFHPPPTWTTQTSKLRNELPDVISSWISLGWSSGQHSLHDATCKRTFSLWLYGLNIRKYGCGSVPVPALHCQPPLFEARSASMSIFEKYCTDETLINGYNTRERTIRTRSPRRQSSMRSFVRYMATIILARLCIQPERHVVQAEYSRM